MLHELRRTNMGRASARAITPTMSHAALPIELAFKRENT